MNEPELWFTERQTQNLSIGLRVAATLHTEQTPYQSLAVYDTVEYGRLLVLDGCVMTTDADEFVYHEMMTHVPLHTHPQPRSVLVVGGGDGGVVREVLKHPSVERVVLAEIDERVVAVAKEFFPAIAQGLNDPRVELQMGDGIRYVQDHPDEFDVILVDSTDPVGPAVGLFQEPFYQSIYRALKADGLMVAQSESPFANKQIVHDVFHIAKRVFPQAFLYLASVPTYPTGLWSFTLGTKKYHPLQDVSDLRLQQTRYYTGDVHKAAFALPAFVRQHIQE
ncbi:polyamine aminopropyltransferase [Alicyclobacillaceae bacterium I2511]|nr:polyamine aminopropyltransferase [Alicyclobacillaceae bacterium I2511]